MSHVPCTSTYTCNSFPSEVHVHVLTCTCTCKRVTLLSDMTAECDGMRSFLQAEGNTSHSTKFNNYLPCSGN